ncbi:MAG: tRNA pseudouridine(55) synthase TruB [Parachlamydiales bacterium]|nr:tRNA pseudouridine(55) synthase TruB [Parachlamydiales bacterium]
MNNFEGILLVNKSQNKSSFSIVSILRKVLKVKKIGHCGTLDPFADGLMVMLIGKKYTRQSNLFLNQDKEYLAKLHLGYITNTFDTESEKEFVSDKVPTIDEIEKALDNFKGKIKQIPPMFSAKKVNGQKLYELARKGITIKREPIDIEIFKLEIFKYEYPFLQIRVKCSKGTYIRTLANDIGEKLNTGAYLSSLTRTKCGDFDIKDAIDQDKLTIFPLETFITTNN